MNDMYVVKNARIENKQEPKKPEINVTNIIIVYEFQHQTFKLLNLETIS